MDEERTPMGLPERAADPPFENCGLTPPEVAFERFLRDKHNRREDKYSHICARVAVEDLPPGHLYRWFTEWMNRQLSDIGVNSTAGVPLPPLHFELVRVNGDQSAAHTFPSEEYSFIVVTQPMFDEMLRLARLLVDGNRAFFSLQIAPEAGEDNPTPTPKLNSHLGLKFRSVTAKICCCCCCSGSKRVIGPSAP
jgi:hypothetical protein